MRTVGKYLKPYIGKMVLQLSTKLAGTVMELFLPSILSIILDVYAPKGDMHGVVVMGCAMIVCAVLAWLGNITANKMSTNISREVTRALRFDLFTKCEMLSNSQRDAITEASLVSRLTSDTYNVHNMIDRLQRLGIRAPIMLIGGIIVSLTLDPVLTLVLLGTLPVLGAVIVFSSRKGVPLFTKVQQAQDKMVRKVQENMAGARVIKALSRTGDEREAFGNVNEGLASTQRTADLTMATVSPVVNAVLNIGLAVVVLVGAVRVSQGLALPGTIIAFLSYFTIILNALLSISRIFVMYSKGSASAKRIEEVLTMPEDLKWADEGEKDSAPNADEGENFPNASVSCEGYSENGDLAHSSTNPPCSSEDKNPPVPHVEFRNVTFSYNKRYDNIKNVSFSVFHGQTLGIIGPTGSGKSTLLHLMMRLYDPDKGQVIIDGTPVNCFTTNQMDKFYHTLGVVFQNDFIMADTIGENIRFGRNITENEMWQGISTAQADFIREKEGQLGFELNVKGRNLSGGQQQRVLISRALSGKPHLVILDDCSSALDFRTDRELRHALRKNHSATTVIVTQRVSSVMGADIIIVMDNGAITGMGTHEELRKSCTMYRELCALQLGNEEVSQV